MHFYGTPAFLSYKERRFVLSLGNQAARPFGQDILLPSWSSRASQPRQDRPQKNKQSPLGEGELLLRSRTGPYLVKFNSKSQQIGNFGYMGLQCMLEAEICRKNPTILFLFIFAGLRRTSTDCEILGHVKTDHETLCHFLYLTISLTDFVRANKMIATFRCPKIRKCQTSP